MASLSPYFTHTATGSAALSSTLDPDKNWVLVNIRFHLDAIGGTENFTVTEDATEGVAFDTVLLTQDMCDEADLFQHYEHPGVPFKRGDAVTFAFANGGGATFGLKVIYREEV